MGFRTLRADEIECRINQISEKRLTLLLYKTARTDASLLDETVGPERWENDFKLVDGVLYGGIGVDYEGNGHFVWKWDAGVESFTEAEKGRASDAFKRAGFKHGIGRALYTAPDVTIFSNSGTVNIKKNDKGKFECWDKFEVTDIAYDDNDHTSRLVIIANGKTCFEWDANKKSTVKRPAPKVEAPKPAEAFAEVEAKAKEHFKSDVALCEECNATIEDTVINGKTYKKADIIVSTRRKYAKTLCVNCAMKHKDEKAG